MGRFLNPNNKKFLGYYNDKIFIDKSSLINIINDNLGFESSKYMCVTRPRRFGKTLTLSMLNAYYSKGCNSKEIFDKLDISKGSTYLDHLNKHNVILIDMSTLYTDSNGNFLEELKKLLLKELDEYFPNILDCDDDTIAKAIIKINLKTDQSFIFLIDEWDVIFREEPNSKMCDEYIRFLRTLFKGEDTSLCIDLVYMTGILPIRKYSTQSTLNMFEEYNMIKPLGLESYIGFTEDEVKNLCIKYNLDFVTMKKWYDGYRLNNVEIYNPRSVSKAVSSKNFDDYWTSTSATEVVTNYMNYDNGSLQDKIVSMLAGKKIKIEPSDFENDLTKVDSEDAALTVLIHLGYLAYDQLKGECYIPNYEIALEFEKGLKKLKWNNSYDPISNSLKLYEETLKGNTDFINKTLDINHNELATVYNKNKEDVLGIIVQISYYRINNFYFIRKEDTSTKGRADLTFTPCDNVHIPMIIELKVDKSADTAINQIKEKDYSSVFKGYKGKVLLLGITYDSSTLKHESKIEYIEL